VLNNTILKDAKRICQRVNLDVLRDSTILVTGASGLIGTYILASLCCLREQGFRAQVYAQHLSELPSHVADLISRGGFRTVRTNFADPDDYAHLPEADIIIHAAGYAQPSRFMADPIATVQVNTSATIALLKKLRSDGRFLFVSTSEVYSGLDKQFLSENDIGLTTPYHPRAVYIEGKRCGETICNAMRTKGINAAIARVALAYGPGTRKNDKRALNSFIEKALFQRKIELLDAGTAKRTYCYVADTVELLWQILLYGREPVYNVGGHSTVTIAELATMIGKMVGVPVAFPATQAEISGAPKEVCLDLTRIEKEFGKTQYVGLEDGLRATIEWQRALYM
jgi:nucleoside-diphosphate-sugar epimerase